MIMNGPEGTGEGFKHHETYVARPAVASAMLCAGSNFVIWQFFFLREKNSHLNFASPKKKSSRSGPPIIVHFLLIFNFLGGSKIK